MPTFDYTCEVCGAEGREWRPKKPPRFCSRRCMSLGMAGVARGRVKYVITPEMSARIREVYRTMTGNGEVAALARELGLPRWKVTRYAVSQGWIARTRQMPDWSEKELRILEHAAHLHPKNIRKRLSAAGFCRSETAIVLKRKRMRFLQNLKGQSARQTAECFGVDVKVITRWIRLGMLNARRRGTKRTAAQGGDQWWIRPKDIRAFVVDYLPEIDIRKVDKYWFVDLLAGDDATQVKPKGG